MCDGNVVINFNFNNVSKDITINFNEINNLDGVNGFFSLISNKLQYQLTPNQYDIKIYHNKLFINIIDINQLFYFISSNILLNQLTQLFINVKPNCDFSENFEDDIFQMNKINLKPINNNNNKIICSICHTSSMDNHYIQRLGKIYGPFKYSNKKYYGHFLCILWLPNVYINNEGKLKNVETEIYRANKEKCSYCNIRGAGLGCLLITEGKCKNTFHYLCAFAAGCNVNKTSYELLCYKHKNKYQFHQYLNYKNDKKINDNNCIEKKNILNCDICQMSCIERFINCTKCKRNYHWECIGYNPNNKIIINDDENDNEEENYICLNCL